MDNYDFLDEELGNMNHIRRLLFMKKFFEKIDIMYVQTCEEKYSYFYFASEGEEYERKVFDCGEEGNCLMEL